MSQEIPIKLTPLHPVARRLGAQLVEHHGWQIPKVYTNLQSELEAARQRVALADASPNGRIAVEGAEVEQIVGEVYGLDGLDIGSGAAAENLHIYRLRRDVFFVHTPPGGEEGELKRLNDRATATKRFVTVSDSTHGQCEMRIIGPQSSALLRQVCGLDFHKTTFADGMARQTSVAKINQLIIRRDLGALPSFALVGARSMGEYLWGVLWEAGEEWDIAPVGMAALDSLH